MVYDIKPNLNQLGGLFIISKPITYEDALKLILSLSYKEFQKVVKTYSEANKSDFKKDMELLMASDFENRLSALNVNNTCPQCSSSHIVKIGKENNIQRYQCKDCKKKFTLFTGTILEKTKWHWDLWVKVLEMVLNDYSVIDMKHTLETDYNCAGIDKKTIWHWRMKLIHALASLPMPELTGVIQIDETFVRESQKGSRKGLVSMIKGEKRKPRYGRKPSKYGVMGPEFVTVVTAVDDRGYCVCKVACLGKLTPQIFTDLFDNHLINPTFICSDANSVYDDYCKVKKIPHYEKPSNYSTLLTKKHYNSSLKYSTTASKADIEKNEKIIQRLYYDEEIDHITNTEGLLYDEFLEVKSKYGLSLGRVNELHSDLKKYINTEMTNVASKYLQDYIGFFTFRRNWRIANGHYPTAQKDAEEIFIQILQKKINYTLSDIEKQQLDLPKPTDKYNSMLIEETQKARYATANNYFKFSEEDGVIKFNKRKYLNNLPKSKLLAICKEYNLTHCKKMCRFNIISLILQQPNIEKVIYKLIENDRSLKISEEDLQAIKDQDYIT